MNLQISVHGKESGVGRYAGFTLPEVMMASGLLVILLGATIGSHLFGMRIMERISAKSSASGDARKTIYTLHQEVSSAKNAAVGAGNASSFTAASMNSLQTGNALQIYPSTNTNVFIRYYLDTSTKTLWRRTESAGVGASVAGAIKNTNIFALEDYSGSVLSNSQSSAVVALDLQFSQVQNANFPVGPTNSYTGYQVRTKIARRTL